ncbi:patatin-like phospholipase family protein [Streptomyces sp. NBC_01622]|uniref:hypothetical protein n=1 Tax=Streptomyces sp. NBC_01622 TaxID=2975903 RepID=UPI00386E6736|nr:patatin-like phospholipase family protein [Streptomyces sp. NBC_01622]
MAPHATPVHGREWSEPTFESELGVSTGCDDKVRDLYVRLLDLLDVTVGVDMLSGTSAGGINGALLGLARANSLDLGDLREFWLKSGDFDTLLRDLKETRPPSMLQGDGVLCSAVAIWVMSGEDTLLGLSSAVLLAVGCLLFGLGAWGVSRRLFPTVLALLLTAGIVVATTVKHDDLFGRATKPGAEKDVGWVGDNVLPWRRESPSHPLIVFGGLIVLSVLISGAVGKLARTVRRKSCPR